jgi:signal transduction histidine kinase
MKKLVGIYKDFVFGKNLELDFQKRIFLLITHISIIIGIVGILVDIVLDLGIFLILVTVFAVLILGFLHIKTRNSRLQTHYTVVFFLFSILVFSLLWFYNGGYNSNIVVLIFIYFIVILTILPAKLRQLSFIIYAVLITTLTLLNYYYPQIITPYENDFARFIDLVLGYFLYLILAYNIQSIIIKNYEKDREKINIQNDQLNNLVEKLNDANIKIENSFKDVEELNASKDRFITVLSHDLRSPFQGLLGITNILDSEYDSFNDKEKRFYITQVNNSVEKLYSFLEELLLWGRVQRNAVKLNFESTIIKELLAQIVSQLSVSAMNKKISIEIICPESLTADLDKEMISIVIRNLISNAVKFSTVGGKIIVTAILDGNRIKISISDKGIGISEENIPKLFKIDENITTIGTDGERGSGMGLILCNDILKKLNGEISVLSKEGRGSTFTVIIPQYNN